MKDAENLRHRESCPLYITHTGGIFLVVAGTGARGGLFGAGGRFKGGTDPIMEKFNESISFDKR